jgi:hypothetical protein
MSNNDINNEMNDTPMKDTSIEDENMEEIVEVLPEVIAAREEEQSTATTPPVPPPSSSSQDATFKSTSVALVEKLLAFSTPRLDVKIVNVLFLEGMFITKRVCGFCRYTNKKETLTRHDGYFYDTFESIRRTREDDRIRTLFI